MTSSPEYRVRVAELLQQGHDTAVGEMIEDAYKCSDEHVHLPELIGEAFAILRSSLKPSSLVGCPGCSKQVDPECVCCSVVAKPCPVLVAKTQKKLIPALGRRDFSIAEAVREIMFRGGDVTAATIQEKLEEKGSPMSLGAIWVRLNRLQHIDLLTSWTTPQGFRKRRYWRLAGVYAEDKNNPR